MSCISASDMVSVSSGMREQYRPADGTLTVWVTTMHTDIRTGTRPPATGGASAGAPKAVTASSDAGKADFASKVIGKGSEDQAAAAGKGFSEEVERGYRNQHPDLEPYYAQIDGQLMKMNFNRAEVLEKFRRQGSLGEFAPTK